MADSATTAVVSVDLLDMDEVWPSGPVERLHQAVALMFVAVVHCIPDEDDPAAIAARYLAALAPGSCVVLSHSTDGFAPTGRTRPRPKPKRECPHETVNAYRPVIEPNIDDLRSVNAMIESFGGRVQAKPLNRQQWRTRLELANALFGYLEILHGRRRHTSLGVLTPIEYHLRASTAELVA
jgi:hypothetical protein